MYECSAVLNVGEPGLEYVDEYDDIRVISFEACGEQAVKRLGDPAAANCVGRRGMMIDQSGAIQYTLEFFTVSPTMFAADDKAQLERLCGRIEGLGWRVV